VTGPDYSEVYILFLNNFFFAQVTKFNVCYILLTTIRRVASKVPGDGFIGKHFILQGFGLIVGLGIRRI